MALSAYLTLTGQKQGVISGTVTQAGRENSILIHSFNHGVISPRDPASGLATGKRQHQPLIITKEIDKTSPPVWTALINNENLTAWELQFWASAADPNAPDAHIYSIRLTNASVASIQESMSDNDLPANAGLPLLEQISFTYQKIEWIWIDGVIEATDDWESPVS